MLHYCVEAVALNPPIDREFCSVNIGLYDSRVSCSQVERPADSFRDDPIFCVFQRLSIVLGFAPLLKSLDIPTTHPKSRFHYILVSLEWIRLGIWFARRDLTVIHREVGTFPQQLSRPSLIARFDEA